MTAEDKKPISLEEARLEQLRQGSPMGMFILTVPASHGPLHGINLNLKIQPAETLEWAKWYEKFENRMLAEARGNGWRVSTIFLGLDHGFGFSKAPVLWESMVFGGPHDGVMRRYDDWELAHTGHLWLVKQCENVGKWRMFCFNMKMRSRKVLRWLKLFKSLMSSGRH